MTKSELANKLKNAIKPAEWNLLKDKEDNSLIINDFNRDVICRMMGSNVDSEDVVDESDVKTLKNLLIKYLQKYMQEQPTGHKWIIIASIYLTFIENKPMHPLEKVGIVTSEINGNIIYKCPYKERRKDSICNYCISHYLQQLYEKSKK